MGFQRFLTVEALEALGRKAVEAGNRCDLWSDNGRMRRLIRWDISGSCEAAIPLELHARYSATHYLRKKPMTVILETKCRRCGWCRDQRRKQWAARARAEYQATALEGARTWFCTLTLAPDNQFLALCTARVRLAKQGVNFDELPDVEKFSRQVSVIGEEITRFIKRVRKNSAAKIRYLIVAEAHQSGAPHFHMLIHEQIASAPLRKAIIKDAWIVGFSKVTLADDIRGAMYLCKYLAKDARTRVRASFRYGGNQDVLGHSNKNYVNALTPRNSNRF